MNIWNKCFLAKKKVALNLIDFCGSICTSHAEFTRHPMLSMIVLFYKIIFRLNWVDYWKSFKNAFFQTAMTSDQDIWFSFASVFQGLGTICLVFRDRDCISLQASSGILDDIHSGSTQSFIILTGQTICMFSDNHQGSQYVLPFICCGC